MSHEIKSNSPLSDKPAAESPAPKGTPADQMQVVRNGEQLAAGENYAFSAIGTSYPLNILNERHPRTPARRKIERDVMKRLGVPGRKTAEKDPTRHWFDKTKSRLAEYQRTTWDVGENETLIGLLECARQSLETMPREHMAKNPSDGLKLARADRLLRTLVETLEVKTIPINPHETRMIAQVREEMRSALEAELLDASSDSDWAERDIFQYLRDPWTDFEGESLRSISNTIELILDWTKP
jgi:hypothetical protein